MLYVKKDINESIDEYVIDERDILELIERVLGDEFRREVESKIANKDRILELEREIESGDEQFDELTEELESATEELSDCEDYINDLRKEIEELEDKLKEVK